jgi:hypothetical protein
MLTTKFDVLSTLRLVTFLFLWSEGTYKIEATLFKLNKLELEKGEFGQGFLFTYTSTQHRI